MTCTNNPSSLPLLFRGEQRRTYLFRRSQPDYQYVKQGFKKKRIGKKRTEHCRMQAVSEGDQDRGGQYDQENMAKEEV